MIESLSLWVKNIVLVVLFASFLELILPSSRMQIFIRVIMGLFIMMAILNPVIDFIHSKVLVKEVPAIRSVRYNYQDIDNSINKIAKGQQKLAREVYCEDLAKQITATVNAIEGVVKAETAVILKSTDHPNNMPHIERIIVYISQARKQDKIVPVKINNSQRSNSKNSTDRAVENKIKRTLCQLYPFKPDQIYVEYFN